jgi:tetratricopeptide (TPR) repeat protein
MVLMYALFEESGKFQAGRLMSEAEASVQVELDSGKRVKVKAAHVLLRFDKPAPAALIETAQRLATEIDLDLAWEFAPEAEFSFIEFARDYFDASAGAERQAAALFRLFDAPHYFRRAGKGVFRKAPEETVKAALQAIERKQQHLDVALNLYQEVFDRSLESLGESHELTSQAAMGLAEVTGNLKGVAYAIPMLERAVEVVEKAHGTNSVAHLVVRGRLGEALLTSGQFDRAEPILQSVLDDRRRVIGPAHPTNFSILGWLADCWQANGELERAKTAYRESIDGYQAANMSDSPLIARTETRLGTCLTKLKEFDEAEQVLLDAESRFAKIKSLRPEWIPLNRRAIYELYQAWNRKEDAMKYEF